MTVRANRRRVAAPVEEQLSLCIVVGSSSSAAKDHR